MKLKQKVSIKIIVILNEVKNSVKNTSKFSEPLIYMI